MSTHDELQALNGAFAAAFAARDFATCARHFAEDGRFMADGAPIVRGRAAIESMFKGFSEAGVKAVRSVVTLEVIESGDLVIEVGSEVVDTEQSDGTRAELPFKYLAVYRRKADGKLEMLVDAPSSDVPSRPG